MSRGSCLTKWSNSTDIRSKRIFSRVDKYFGFCNYWSRKETSLHTRASFYLGMFGTNLARNFPKIRMFSIERI